MKYVKIGWPEIQDYMFRPDYLERCYFDPIKNAWFIPEDWEENTPIDEEEPEIGTKEYFDAHDCWDALGGDWYG